MIVHEGIRHMPEVDPTMGILMSEERRKWNKSIAVISCPGIAAGPAAPRGSGQRISGGTQAQTINNHPFIITNPIAEPAEACCRLPAHRNGIGSARHEVPIHAVKDRVRSRADR